MYPGPPAPFCRRSGGAPLALRPVNDDERWLALAVEQARLGRAEGGIPIGAVLVADGRVLGAGRNRRVQLGSAIRHGETDAIENAGRLPAATYRRSTMFTTLSPCFMCAGTILLYGIPRVVSAATSSRTTPPPISAAAPPSTTTSSRSRSPATDHPQFLKS